MRVQRSFAFVDLSGFTSFTERNGDEHAVLVLAELRAVMREIAARRGVRVVKWLGDGAMMSSTEADGLVAAIIEIDARMSERLPVLAVRAGMDVGPVIMFEGDDYIGRPVNVASRLCDRAGPHVLLATTEMAARAPGWVQATRTTPVLVRGIDRPVDLVRLVVAPTDDGVTDPVCGLTIPRSAAIEKGAVWYCSEACAVSVDQPDPEALHR